MHTIYWSSKKSIILLVGVWMGVCCVSWEHSCPTTDPLRSQREIQGLPPYPLFFFVLPSPLLPAQYSLRPRRPWSHRLSLPVSLCFPLGTSCSTPHLPLRPFFRNFIFPKWLSSSPLVLCPRCSLPPHPPPQFVMTIKGQNQVLWPCCFPLSSSIPISCSHFSTTLSSLLCGASAFCAPGRHMIQKQKCWYPC